MCLKHGIFENHSNLNRLGYAFAISAFSKNCFNRFLKRVFVSSVSSILLGLRYNSRSRSSYALVFVTEKQKFSIFIIFIKITLSFVSPLCVSTGIIQEQAINLLAKGTKRRNIRLLVRIFFPVFPFLPGGFSPVIRRSFTVI